MARSIFEVDIGRCSDREKMQVRFPAATLNDLPLSNRLSLINTLLHISKPTRAS